MRTKSSEKADIILSCINSYFDEYKSSPSLREIENSTGIPRQTALRYLNDMNDKNTLSYDGKTGSIITAHMNDITRTDIKRLPIVGRIACGDPFSQEQEDDGYVDFPSSLLGSGKYFVLKAYGDSMINAGIEEGDLVIIRQTNEASKGQIVAAIDEDGRNTLKRLKYDSKLSRLYLHPENEEYSDIYPTMLQIQGVAVKVIKDLI